MSSDHSPDPASPEPGASAPGASVPRFDALPTPDSTPGPASHAISNAEVSYLDEFALHPLPGAAPDARPDLVAWQPVHAPEVGPAATFAERGLEGDEAVDAAGAPATWLPLVRLYVALWLVVAWGIALGGGFWDLTFAGLQIAMFAPVGIL